MRAALTVLVLALLVAGCATTNGYRDFYTGTPGVYPERSAPPPSEPLVARAAGFEGIAEAYARKGYAPIGHSSFSSGRDERESDAIEVGKEVGADLVVLINPEYAGSETTSIPITTPTSTTSHTSGTATAYGAGGTTTAYGNATTTTYGSKTTYVPMTVHRYEYGAVYLVKYRYILGARWRDLTDDERRELQTNRGVYVMSVVDGSPAYESDVLPGDVIVAIDGKVASGGDGFNSLVQANRGRAVELTIARQGKVISKSVSLLE